MAVPTVAITGTVVTPDGATPVTGVIQCKLSQPGTAVDGGAAVRVIPYATGSVTNGVPSLSLVPNDAITPTGTFYQVSFSVTLASGRNVAWTENWQLASTPTSIAIGSVPRIDSITGTVTDTSTLRAEIAQSLSVAQGYANDAVTGVLAGTGAVPATWAFTGDGTTTQFTLTGATHASAAMYLVALSGVTQAPTTDYSINLGTSKIVFTSAPANGVPIAVRSMGYARAISEGDTLLVTATGSTMARKEADRWADVVNVKDFGAKGDGVTDDTAAIQAALDTGKRRVEFPDGTYRVASGLTVSTDVEIRGPGATLRVDFVGTGITVAAGKRFEVYGLAFDGRGKAKVLVDLTTPPSFVFERCAFSNVYGSTGAVRALSIASPTAGRIEDCSFSHLYMLANGVEGDTDGAVRAVYLSSYSGEPKDVRIVGNRFSDIHSVAAGTTDSFGNPSKAVMEDADAIHVSSVSGYLDANVLIEGNYFENVGKRAVKYAANKGIIRSNWIVSSWPDAADPIYPDMMFAAIEVFGHGNVVAHNKVLGTYYQHGIAVGDPAVTTLGNTVEGNEIIPTGTVFDNANQTVRYGTRNGIFANRQHDLKIANNRVVAAAGFAAAFRTNTLAQKVAVVGNVFTNNVVSVNVSGGAVTGLVVSGNVIIGRASGSVIGVYVVGSSDRVAITGNEIDDVQDAIKFDAPQPTNASIAGNALSQVRGSHLLGWPGDLSGAGSPESAIAAPPGTTYRRTDGGAGTGFYVKETGTANTGWIAK